MEETTEEMNRVLRETQIKEMKVLRVVPNMEGELQRLLTEARTLCIKIDVDSNVSSLADEEDLRKEREQATPQPTPAKEAPKSTQPAEKAPLKPAEAAKPAPPKAKAEEEKKQ